MYFRFISGIMFRRYNCDTIRHIHFFPQNCGKVHGKFKWCKRKITIWLQEQSIQVMRACTKQFEFIAAQRIRRSIQIFHLYTRIWDEIALKEFIRLCRFRITKNTQNFLMGAIGVTMYNWDHERIPDQEMYSYDQEIEEIHRLRNLTVICPECHLRVVIDVIRPEVKYCQCYKRKLSTNTPSKSDWEPFTECKDMIVWRREEKDYSGLYAYKVYGSLNDVSAEDFLHVQIDLDYRTKWDSTVKELKIIDTDPLGKESIESCGDVIYWETIWPRMFSNRDYVYQRKWIYNKETGIVIIVNKQTKHPNAPNRSDTYRVSTYWSFMVIKPFKTFQEPGVEFGLTYFDDPGVNVPAVTAWIIMSGLTNYLYQMREAVKNYQNYKTVHVSKNTISNVTIRNSEEEKIDNTDVNHEQDDYEKYDQTIPDNINGVATDSEDRHVETEVKVQESCNENIKEESESELEDEEQRVLNYRILAKLFA